MLKHSRCALEQGLLRMTSASRFTIMALMILVRR